MAGQRESKEMAITLPLAELLKDKSRLQGLVDRELIVADLDLANCDHTAREWNLGYWRALDLVERDLASYRITDPREYLRESTARARESRDLLNLEESDGLGYGYEYFDGYHRALARLLAKLENFGGSDAS